MNTINIYTKYYNHCKSQGIHPLGKNQFTAIVWCLEDLKKTEPYTIALMNDMCEESLSPEVFKKWESVRSLLENNRTQLKK